MRNGDITSFKNLEEGTKSVEALIEIYDTKAKKAALVGDPRSAERNRAIAEKLAKSLELKTLATKRLNGNSENL